MRDAAFAPSRGRAKAERVIASLEPLDDFELLVVADFIGDRLARAGSPQPPFTTIAAEADAWASFASIAELKGYIAAAVTYLSPGDRTSLAAWLAKRA